MTAPLWYRQLLTEDDANSVYDPVRVIGATGFLSLLAGTAYIAITKQTFDPFAFSSGVAAIAGAVGVGAGVKAHLGA